MCMQFYDFFLILLYCQVYGNPGSIIPLMLVGTSGANTPGGTTGVDTRHCRNQPCLHTQHLGSSNTSTESGVGPSSALLRGEMESEAGCGLAKQENHLPSSSSMHDTNIKNASLVQYLSPKNIY